MATAHKTVPLEKQERGTESPNKEQLRKDRIKGVVVIVVLAALMALMIWLASLGNGGGVEDVNDYWPMMP